MWLPETAVDRETLALLGDAGIRLTILAPSQAQRVRRLGTDQWVDVGGERIDPRQAYHHTTMRGRRLALFFYDGPISRAIAFEGAAASGETLAARLLAGFQPERTDPQLVHVATDGESYGHHTPRGETALAAALAQLERTGGLALTNYGEFLAAHPPACEVEIADGTSWSCAHGVERWRSDCGCRVGHPGWHQQWRAPLREALDWLRDQLDPFYETRLSTLLRDPWAARDDYIHVILDRSPERKAAFFARHARRPMDHRTRVEALKFLEIQRQRLLMYTSCGWFFDDIGGLEAVQVLKYAARAIQLADDLGLKDLEPELLHRLAAAPSNVPELENGAQVYRRLVLPLAVDFARVVAHHAISRLREPEGKPMRIFVFAVRELDVRRETMDDTALLVGRAQVESEITDATEEARFAALRVGEQDYRCSVQSAAAPSDYETLKDDLFECYRASGASGVASRMSRHFPGRFYALQDLLPDDHRPTGDEPAESPVSNNPD
jgi:alpha-amylase/alpha-mannosidase (GH57 family)